MCVLVSPHLSSSVNILLFKVKFPQLYWFVCSFFRCHHVNIDRISKKSKHLQGLNLVFVWLDNSIPGFISSACYCKPPNYHNIPKQTYYWFEVTGRLIVLELRVLRLNLFVTGCLQTSSFKYSLIMLHMLMSHFYSFFYYTLINIKIRCYCM